MDDKADTIDAIVAAAELPVSVVVAGLKAPVRRCCPAPSEATQLRL